MTKWLRDKQLREKLGDCSDMQLWRLRKAGKLPQPKKLNGLNYSLESEVDQALEALFEMDERGTA